MYYITICARGSDGLFDAIVNRGFNGGHKSGTHVDTFRAEREATSEQQESEKH